MTTRLKAKYLLWVTSKQGTAPYFQRVYPKHVAAIMRETGRDIKVTKRLPVHMQASDVEIVQALDKCNRDFENSIKAYTDPNNRKALHEHDVLKAALALLEMHGLKPGGNYPTTAIICSVLQSKLLLVFLKHCTIYNCFDEVGDRVGNHTTPPQWGWLEQCK